MKFVGKSNVHERENRVCGESEVCVGDGRLASDVYGKNEFVGENEVQVRGQEYCS